MSTTLTGGSLFTGYGGLDLAVAWTLYDLGVDVRFRWDCDIKPAAKTLLEHRRPHAPNLGDIHDIATPLVETPPVDLLTFGWPCQPHSSAGKRLGEADPRALWPQVHRVITSLRPTYLFGENVSRVAGVGELRRVVRSLAEIGYVGTWRCLRASDVGAPHRRDRLFLFAVRSDAAADALGLLLRDEPGRGSGSGREGAGVAGDDGAERAAGHGELRLLKTPTAQLAVNGGTQHPDKRKRGGHGPTLADEVEWLLPSPTARLGASGSVTPAAAAAARAARRPNGPNLDDAIALLPTPNASDGPNGGPSQRGRRGDWALPAIADLLPTPTVADSRGGRNATAGRSPGQEHHHVGWTLTDVAYANRWGKYADAIRRWEQETGRPAPDATEWSPKSGRGILAPAFVEWMMGLPAGWVTDVPGLTRAQQLSLLGDGVVPQQARHAYRQLIADLATATEAGAA